jgi:hypothetical protein
VSAVRPREGCDQGAPAAFDIQSIPFRGLVEQALVGVGVDVTEQVAQHAQLQQSRRQYRELAK